MKKQLSFLLLLFISLHSFGQEEFVALEKKEDYKKAEPIVQNVVDFLLSNPTTFKEEVRKAGYAFVIKWMSGTPDHTFSISAEGMNLLNSDEDYLAMYMAAQTKFAFDNLDKKLTPVEIEKGGIVLFFEYCANPVNEMKFTKGMKKYLKKNKLQ
ncbi:hypothetical protein [Flammeovirga pacifica]|uniref:Uncharacterized protein n=1 Tax=Flammeovirga pacifica TaxID=915059 RepID=A0A1S1YZB3_FLAPC|nr:hypothetical protein [Flammeovirga pacifica]OHX66356.1 hypothetical protein NH26_08325 [Flammeovirga pacifica]